MLTFEIQNLYTKATGPGHEMHILRNILSCYVPGYSFTKAYKEGRWNGKKYFLTKKGFLPTGLLPYAIKKLPPWIQINKIDQRNIPQLTCREPCVHQITLRPYQIGAISIACSKKRGVIQAPAGSGKTEIAIGIISSLSYPKTLYLVHQSDLMYQSAERIKKRLQCEPGLMGDGNYKEKRITVAMVQTLWPRIREPLTELFLRNTELLIIDECHHASATTWYKIAMKTRAFFRFGLSATPLVANSLKNMKLAAATGPLIVKIREDKLVEHGYLCSPKIKIFNVQSPTLPPYMSYPMAYEQGIIRNATRNLLIEDLAKKLVAEGRTVLILVEAIEHGYFCFPATGRGLDYPPLFRTGNGNGSYLIGSQGNLVDTRFPAGKLRNVSLIYFVYLYPGRKFFNCIRQKSGWKKSFFREEILFTVPPALFVCFCKTVTRHIAGQNVAQDVHFMPGPGGFCVEILNFKCEHC